jgi:hypothetical protein
MVLVELLSLASVRRQASSEWSCTCPCSLNTSRLLGGKQFGTQRAVTSTVTPFLGERHQSPRYLLIDNSASSRAKIFENADIERYKIHIGVQRRIPRPPICPAYSSIKLSIPVHRPPTSYHHPCKDNPFLHYVTSLWNPATFFLAQYLRSFRPSQDGSALRSSPFSATEAIVEQQ